MLEMYPDIFCNEFNLKKLQLSDDHVLFWFCFLLISLYLWIDLQLSGRSVSFSQIWKLDCNSFWCCLSKLASLILLLILRVMDMSKHEACNLLQTWIIFSFFRYGKRSTPEAAVAELLFGEDEQDIRPRWAVREHAGISLFLKFCIIACYIESQRYKCTCSVSRSQSRYSDKPLVEIFKWLFFVSVQCGRLVMVMWLLSVAGAVAFFIHPSLIINEFTEQQKPAWAKPSSKWGSKNTSWSVHLYQPLSFFLSFSSSLLWVDFMLCERQL